MRLKKVKGALEKIELSKYYVKSPEQYKENWNKVFENENPIRLEIGMGKGNFIIGMAKKFPNINFIGIEMYDSVMVKATDSLEKEEYIPNLKLILMDARNIENVFGKEIDRIYLNFSDPWPKARHAKRRLPSREFLRRYDCFLKKDGVLEFKTDNRDLFDFALEELSFAGWEALQVTYDLHHDEKMSAGNIMTEYEEKFSSKGNPIYKYIIRR